ncbi:MAG: hypothetical protein PHR94_11575 [Methylomonas lenta]|jgi:hypothetical protein|nr:hypothetical protein [Methylomonas lenta]
MDNDILINQARQLYVDLQIRQINTHRLDRLDRLSMAAYQRYQRRLNRCAICYQTRNYDCIREPGEKLIPCPRRQQAKNSA